MNVSQIALDIDGTAPAYQPGAFLRVNEAIVYLYGSRDTANWWALYRTRGPAARFTIVTAAIPGDLVDVECDDREHAAALRDLCLERGIPKSALTIRRPERGER